MFPRSLFRGSRQAAPWAALVAVFVSVSLTVGAPGAAVATRTAAQPASTATDPAASAVPDPNATVDTGPSTPTPLPPPSAVPTPIATASAAVASQLPHRASVAAPKTTKWPSGCCATGGSVNASAGLFEDLQYLTGSALSSRLDQYAAAGAKVARFQVIWGNVQSSGPSSYDWQYIDAVVAGLNARGIRALPVLDTTPSWARPAGCSQLVCAPANPSQYATFAGAAAARYAPQGVHSWEIWNEPNNPIFWQPAPNTTTYTAVLKAAYTAIHAADPSATVVTGGLAPAATGGGWIAPVQFLSEIYANGGQGSFDAVGWHPYDYPDVPSSTSNNAWYQMSGSSTSARSLMVAHGDGGKRIWATEFGAPTCTGNSTCVSETQQAAMITEVFALWRSYSWAGPLVMYTYADTGQDESNREDYFGLVRYDGSQKPGYTAFHVAAHA